MLGYPLWWTGGGAMTIFESRGPRVRVATPQAQLARYSKLM